jgi:hypothetical protein
MEYFSILLIIYLLPYYNIILFIYLSTILFLFFIFFIKPFIIYLYNVYRYRLKSLLVFYIEEEIKENGILFFVFIIIPILAILVLFFIIFLLFLLFKKYALILKNKVLAFLAYFGIYNIIIFFCVLLGLAFLFYSYTFTLTFIILYLFKIYYFHFFAVMLLFLIIFPLLLLFYTYGVLFSIEEVRLPEDSDIRTLRHRLTNSYGTIIPIDPLIVSAKRTDMQSNSSLYFFVYNWRSMGQHFLENKDVIRYNLTTDLMSDALFYIHNRADTFNLSEVAKREVLSKCIYLAQQPTLGGYNLKPVAPEMIQNFIRVSGLNIDLDNIESYGMDTYVEDIKKNKKVMSVCEDLYMINIRFIEKHNFTNPNYSRKIYVDKDNNNF